MLRILLSRYASFASSGNDARNVIAAGALLFDGKLFSNVVSVLRI